MVDSCLYLVLFYMCMILFIKIKEVIVGEVVQDVEVGIKISTTPTCIIIDKVLMVMV